MSDTEKRLGVVVSWHYARQIGTIIDRGTEPPQRFFLIGGRVVEGAEPKVGSVVRFHVEQRPVKPGKLPLAVFVEVLGEIPAFTDALGGDQ
jgi:hypothetical protein